MKIKILALLLVLVLAIGVFASCGTPTPECNHRDADDNYACDECGAPFNDGVEQKPDKPGGGDDDDEKVYEIPWDETSIKLKATENSNNRELPSCCARYLAGTLTEEEKTNDYSQVDIMIGNRNKAAYETTNLKVTYDYFPEGDSYAWSKCIDAINSEVLGGSSGRADIYCNFVYDMVTTSLNNSFANLYSQERGTNYFEFTKNGFEDTGVGYMFEYMRSLTLSKFKMYCLSSDYFTDMVRAFFIVPVNVTLLQSIMVDPECDAPNYNPDAATKYNSDRTGDGEFDIDDFYNLVWDGQWNYSILADFSRAIHQSSGVSIGDNTDKNGNLSDTIGFAVSTSSGLSASGMLYTTSVVIIKRDWDISAQDYKYEYPATNPELYDFCDAITSLFSNNRGVITVNNAAEQCMGYGPDALQAIRNQFASNKVLFGGVICLGSLEYDEYKTMNQGDGNTGYGIVPVPLYRAVNPETNEPDRYLTQIHNLGRIGAISSTTEKFSQCSAFLDYQSLNSTDILDEYYNYKLSFDVAGGDSKNTEMLQYIRYNVRSSFDKAFEDAIGVKFINVDPLSNENKWHNMIMKANFIFDRTSMATKYADLAGTKQGYLKDLYGQYGDLPN